MIGWVYWLINFIALSKDMYCWHWPDLYWRWIICLGWAWAKNGSSSDNPSVYKYGQSCIHVSYHGSPSFETIIVDNSLTWMIRLLAPIYTQMDYQTSYRSLPKLIQNGWSVSSINRATSTYQKTASSEPPHPLIAWSCCQCKWQARQNKANELIYTYVHSGHQVLDALWPESVVSDHWSWSG